jgi:acyl carrier protein
VLPAWWSEQKRAGSNPVNERSISLDTQIEVQRILDEVLSLGGRAMNFDSTTPLLGAIPELDSMAVVTLITTLEERFGLSVDDDEISGDTFATLGSLAAFVAGKLRG